MSVGESIARLRSKYGYTQEELSQKIGVHAVTISKWENGKRFPRAQAIQSMATLFSCTTDEILKPSPPPNSGGNGLIPETPRGASLVGDLREVVELLANLALRSDEPGEVLAFLEDLADGRADKEDTKVFIETLTTQIDASVRFLRSVGASLGHIQEGRFSDVGSVAQEASCLSGS